MALLHYLDIKTNDQLWIHYTELDDPSQSYYYPARVTGVSFKEVTVNYGNVLSFATGWVARVHKAYDEDKTRFQQNHSLTFIVKKDKASTIKTAKHRITLCERPRLKYNTNAYGLDTNNYGDFDGTTEGFIDRVWEIESNAPHPRFTKKALTEFVKDYFVQEVRDADMRIKYPLLFSDIIYREDRQSLYRDTPSARELILSKFFNFCVPYLANKDWFDMVFKSGFNDTKYHWVWRELQTAYEVSQRHNTEALSFVFQAPTVSDQAVFMSVISCLDIDEHSIDIGVENGQILCQMKTSVIEKALCR